eukprot:2072332-Pyramimonas_sp.AAC.2
MRGTAWTLVDRMMGGTEVSRASRCPLSEAPGVGAPACMCVFNAHALLFFATVVAPRARAHVGAG